MRRIRRIHSARWTAYLALGISLSISQQGCASSGAAGAESVGVSGGGGSESIAPASAAAKGTVNYITEQELRDAPGTLQNAFDLIARLRPAMMQNRITPGTRGSTSTPIVFADIRRLGEVSLLRGIARESVREVRYYNPADARGRFGEGLPGGVIQIVIFKQSR